MNRVTRDWNESLFYIANGNIAKLFLMFVLQIDMSPYFHYTFSEFFCEAYTIWFLRKVIERLTIIETNNKLTVTQTVSL